MARSSDGRTVLSRHLDVLDAFRVDAAFLTVSDVARRADMPLSTAHRLLAELAEHGLVERQEDRRYRLGIRLWELASRTPGALGLREIAMPHLQEAHAALRQHIQLGILEGTDVMFLERLSTRDAALNATLVGGRIPLHASSSGLVLLAHAPEAVFTELTSRPLRRYTASTPRTADELRQILARIRREGFAVCDGFIHPASRGVAVPVVGAGGKVVATVAAVVHNDASPTAPLVQVLHLAATRIGEDLRAASLPASDPDAYPGGRYRPVVHSSEESMRFFSAGGMRAPRPERRAG